MLRLFYVFVLNKFYLLNFGFSDRWNLGIKFFFYGIDLDDVVLVYNDICGMLFVCRFFFVFLVFCVCCYDFCGNVYNFILLLCLRMKMWNFIMI